MSSNYAPCVDLATGTENAVMGCSTNLDGDDDDGRAGTLDAAGKAGSVWGEAAVLLTGFEKAVRGCTENLGLSFDGLAAFENAVNGCSVNFEVASDAG
jgi:hypothetical protein